jgi:hypothetical protein
MVGLSERGQLRKVLPNSNASQGPSHELDNVLEGHL